MIIREAIEKDSTLIAAFQIAMALETEQIRLDEETVNKGVRAVFNDPAKGTYYLAEKNGQVIASLLTTFEWSEWRNGTILWIQSVYVSPDFRGNGVYKSLNDALVEILGTLAGLTFALQNTKLVALAGVIAGIAGALSKPKTIHIHAC